MIFGRRDVEFYALQDRVGGAALFRERSHAYAWMKELMLSTARNN